MDPKEPETRRTPGRFPRTGGDGPRSAVLRVWLRPLPPHGRGWTVGAHAKGINSQASPARAGMDLRPGLGAVAPNGFPRTGGDGPRSAVLRVWLRPLPPHGRGWTVGAHAKGINSQASPARAGMDLRPGLGAVAPNGFPRTGGDGPTTKHVAVVVWRLPPHGRGWTQVGGWQPPPGRASPARAGMDPWKATARCGATDFPRTGGDGPPATPASPRSRTLPPHGRGWTQVPQVHILIESATPV